ncbi:MAG: sulfatase-like hydrolase/transferase, partial [Synechococcaceae cyanobacterium]|nr:sulfatase-like hydrolase/transferase [Synechococcaceae cyanobacterium]
MIGKHSRGILPGVLLLSACSPAGRAASVEPAASPDRPNVLLIVTDDLRCETGAYGAAHVRTPNIDRLARRGMRFDRAYAQATLCSPSRASFLTGLRPDRTGVHDNVIDYRDAMPDAVTLAQLLREHGYTTHRIGKVFHDRKEADDTAEWDAWSYPRSSDVGRRGEGRNLTGGALKWCRWRAAEGGDDDQPDGGIAREAVRFLEQSHDKPFLLALGFHSPHDPFVAPAAFFGPYPLDSQAPPASSGPRSASAAHFSGYQRAFDRFTDTDRREFLRAYRAATSFLDAQVGRVLDALEASPFADRTIVVFLSDHGYHLGEHGWWSKATLFEAAARTPLVVSAP